MIFEDIAEFAASLPRAGAITGLDLGTKTVGVAVSVTLNAAGKVDSISIVLAAEGPTPLRAAAAEALLKGRIPDEQDIAAASLAAATAATPISDVRASAGYRRDMVRVLTARSLTQAIKEAQQ